MDVIPKKEYFTFNDNRTIKNLSSLFSISPNMAKGQFINVETPDRVKVKQQVNKWYFRNAKIKFHLIGQPLIFQFKKHKVNPSSIVMSDMPTRWGSCTRKGKIILNPELMKAPEGCIE
jgi:predicted metal-dependent hydrolase